MINYDTILWKNNLMMDVDGKCIFIIQYNYYINKLTYVDLMRLVPVKNEIVCQNH